MTSLSAINEDSLIRGDVHNVVEHPNGRILLSTAPDAPWPSRVDGGCVELLVAVRPENRSERDCEGHAYTS